MPDTPADDSVRAFVSLAPTPELRAGLDPWLEEARQALHGAPLRWTPCEQIHLTLRFLGQVASADLPAIRQALDDVCAAQPAFALRMQGLGCFPDQRRPRIVWVGLGGELNQLARLHGAVAERLESILGCQPGEKFHPHLTIARTRPAPGQEIRRLAAALERLVAPVAGAWSIEEVRLIRSTLGSAGARHEVISSHPLALRPT